MNYILNYLLFQFSVRIGLTLKVASQEKLQIDKYGDLGDQRMLFSLEMTR